MDHVDQPAIATEQARSRPPRKPGQPSWQTIPSKFGRHHTFTDGELLKRLLAHFQITDAELSRDLHARMVELRNIHADRARLRFRHRLVVLHRAGVTIHHPLLSYLHNNEIARYVLLWAQRNEAVTKRAQIARELTDIQLLELCKRAMNLSDDVALAALLGVEPTLIQDIREDRTVMGAMPRLRLLRITVPDEPFADIERAMHCNTRMMALVLYPGRHPVSEHARQQAALRAQTGGPLSDHEFPMEEIEQLDAP